MNYLAKMMKGYFISFVIFLLLTILLAFFIKMTSLPEGMSFYYLIASICIATFFLGIFSGKLIGRNGLISAIIISAIFVFLIIFSANCIFFRELSLDSFNPLYLIPVIIGGIGGIIGVNVKK
ncbi:MAG: TIGR04086 family membrane protein [Aminipila sp.]